MFVFKMISVFIDLTHLLAPTAMKWTISWCIKTRYVMKFILSIPIYRLMLFLGINKDDLKHPFELIIKSTIGTSALNAF